MSRFSTDVLQLSIGNGKYFTLEESITYDTSVGNPYNPACKDGYDPSPHRRIYIPNSFQTDLNTIPWWIQWYVARLGEYNLASIPHDYILANRELFPEYTRKDADKIYCEALQDLGVSKKHIRVLYTGVRAYSWWKEGRYA